MLKKSVIMMIAQLTNTAIGFLKAYDTQVEITCTIFKMFEFDERFVDFILPVIILLLWSVASHHCSQWVIRQVYSLTPLLFLLVVDMLSITLHQDSSLKYFEAPELPRRALIFLALWTTPHFHCECWAILAQLERRQSFWNTRGLAWSTDYNKTHFFTQ